jgi:hypothetical protein
MGAGERESLHLLASGMAQARAEAYARKHHAAHDGVPAEHRCKSEHTRRYALYAQGAQGASACPQAKPSDRRDKVPWAQLRAWFRAWRAFFVVVWSRAAVNFMEDKFGQSSVVRIRTLFATARYFMLLLRTSNMPLRTKSCKNTSSPSNPRHYCTLWQSLQRDCKVRGPERAYVGSVIVISWRHLSMPDGVGAVK